MYTGNENGHGGVLARELAEPITHEPLSRERILVQRPLPGGDSDPPVLLDYWDLTKPEISFLVTVSALAGFLLGSPDVIQGGLLGALLLGTVLSAAGVGVLNHYLERQYDALMRRTANRPLPSGRVSPRAALIFGTNLTLAGLAIVLFFVNVATSVLAVLTVGLYLFVYTPLKRRTSYNTLVGTIPGALPALGGFVAATGTLGAGGWALFLILACWQMPHFLALAWMYRKDYARAGFVMLPVEHPDGHSTGRQALLFAIGLMLTSTVPTMVGVTGWVYFAGVLALGLWFLFPAYAFHRSHTTRNARRMLAGSILYMPLLVVLIVVDRLL